MEIKILNEDSISDVYCCVGGAEGKYKEEIAESTDYVAEKLSQGWLTYGVYDDTGKVIGMAILIPSSDPLSPIAGEDIYYFHCLDISKDVRKQGIGMKLVDKIVEDIEKRGGKGLVVDCYGEFWMPCKYFKKIGFEPVEDFPEHSMLLRKISEDASVKYMETLYKGDLPQTGIQVDIQYSGICPFMLNNYRKIKEMVRKLEPNAIIRERMVNTERDMKQWGGTGCYVNGVSVSLGPVGEEELKKALAEAKAKNI